MLPSDPEFNKRMKKLKGKLMAEGNDTSIAKLTTLMAGDKIFDEIEKIILEEIRGDELNIIKFDRRKKR